MPEERIMSDHSASARADISREYAADPSRLSFRHFAERWMEAVCPRLKESSRNRYRNLLESYIYPGIGEVAMCCVTERLVQAHCNELLLRGGRNNTGLSPKTVSDILCVMRSVLKFSARSGARPPCDGQDIRVRQTAGKMRVLSKTEQDRLLRYLMSDPNECNMGILVCLFTGLRVGEICGLKWEDISFSEQTIHIHRTMQRIQDREGPTRTRVILSLPKSPSSVRIIPIPGELLQVILAHRTAASGYFLTNSMHRYVEPRTMQNRFKYALRKSGIRDANFHALRHTFATRCVELGFDVKSLSEILGHASVNITMNRYVHPSMELKKENMQRLSRFFATI